MDSTTAKELHEAMVFDSVDPGGSWRDDLQAAQVCAVVANCNRSSKQKAFTYQDFMPFIETKKQQDSKVLSNQIKAFFHGFDRSSNN